MPRGAGRAGLDLLSTAVRVVLVLGMGRSGTSATAGALRYFGLELPRRADLRTAENNERGHSESRSLSAFNERLLNQLGGSWERPPRLEAGWANAAALAELRPEAASTFDAAFEGGQGPVAWKDPHLSLLLPFWRTVLDRPLAVILVHRDPLEVAASLRATSGFNLALGLALWEHYQRAALDAAQGLPVFVSEYEAMLRTPADWAQEIVGFFRNVGVAAKDPDVAALSDWLGQGMRRHPREGRTEGLLLASQVELRDLLGHLAGGHKFFQPPATAVGDGWSRALLEARADAVASWNAVLAGADEALTAAEGPAPTSDSYPLNATQDREAYLLWRAQRGLPIRLPGWRDVLRGQGLPRPATRPADEPPRFSVIVPVFRPPIWALWRCVASVLEQSYASFELCLCDDGSERDDVTTALRQIGRLDSRIRVSALEANAGISKASNRAMSEATGEFVVFLDDDDELDPRALELLAAAADADPEVDLLYSDEDKTDETGALFSPAFKPGYAPDTLLSTAYLCHVLAVRRSLVETLGGLRSEFDGSQDYDLMLRASEQARKIGHVPEVLYHWRVTAGSAAGDTGAKPWAFEAGARAVADALARRGEQATVETTQIPGLYHVRRRVIDEPRVSVIVPFRDEPELLAGCADAVIEAAGYERVELLLVDNGSVLPETATLLDRLAEDPRVVLLEEPGPFSWSAINNAAAAEATGEVLLFLNGDIEAGAPGWLLPMLEHAQRPEVGAVGARLLYPDGGVQHAGAVVGMCRGAGHVLKGLPAELPGYLAWAYMTRNVSAVTGACLMSRRDVFESLGGFWEELPIAFSDIDYCLRLREEDRLVVYTPLAELVHHESWTRGHADDAIEVPRFSERWANVLGRVDPAYSPRLSQFRLWCPLASPEEEVESAAFRSWLGRIHVRA